MTTGKSIVKQLVLFCFVSFPFSTFGDCHSTLAQHFSLRQKKERANESQREGKLVAWGGRKGGRRRREGGGREKR